MISVNDVGIIISNGKGAIINMTGPTVDINVGALTVIWSDARARPPSRRHRARARTPGQATPSRRSRACCVSGQPVVTLAVAVRRRRLRAHRHADAAVRHRAVGDRRGARARRRRRRVATMVGAVDLRRRPARRCCRSSRPAAGAGDMTVGRRLPLPRRRPRPHRRRPTRDDHLRDLIEQVLFTAPGERVMRPDFGSGLLALVFEPNSPSSPRRRSSSSRARCSSGSAT